MIHYHGTPITPRERLYELAGRSFCVSFADPRDVRVCHEIGQTWAVIPDVIDGDEDANNALLVSWSLRGLPKGAPVWHLHESLDRLQRLAAGYERVCFGSSGSYAQIGTPGGTPNEQRIAKRGPKRRSAPEGARRCG